MGRVDLGRPLSPSTGRGSQIIARRWSVGALLMTVVMSALVWAVVAGACLLVGSTGHVNWPTGSIFVIRREVVLLASLVGAALAGAGVAYQAILRNPLADPYLLGVSSGAMLFAYLWQFPVMTPWLAAGEQAFAFVGALVAVSVVLVLASRRGRLEPVTLLLVGVIVNAVNGSIFLLLNAIIKDPATPGGPLTFLVGGLQSNLRAAQVVSAAVIIGLGWVVLLYISGELNVGMLSESEAQALGVRIHRLRWIALIVASLMTASAVAISGPIGFIGLVCPHLARLVVGNDQRRLLPVATAIGACLLALADAASRWLSRPEAAGTALPVGVLTALFGGPFFLLLLWQNRRRATLEQMA
jgi:iron complex transport system permease protein